MSAAGSAEAPPVEVVRDRDRADLLLQHPLRPEILERTREPRSAAELGRLLDIPTQKVNYHVRKLADADFLQLVEEVPRGNLVERRYRASALSYAVSPAALGPVGQGSFPSSDRIAAMHLLSRAERLRDEVVEELAEAGGSSGTVETLTLETEVYLPTAERRMALAKELREAFEGVARRYIGPQEGQTGSPARTGRYRLLLGAWPAPEREKVTRRHIRTETEGPDASGPRVNPKEERE